MNYLDTSVISATFTATTPAERLAHDCKSELVPRNPAENSNEFAQLYFTFSVLHTSISTKRSRVYSPPRRFTQLVRNKGKAERVKKQVSSA